MIDNREQIEIDLPDAELLVLFKMAHERDMTFNNFVEMVLLEALERIENDNLLNQLDGASESTVVQGSGTN
jgi:hypothetical protein